MHGIRAVRVDMVAPVLTRDKRQKGTSDIRDLP